MAPGAVQAGGLQTQMLLLEIRVVSVMAGEAGVCDRLQKKCRGARGMRRVTCGTAIVFAGRGMGYLLCELGLDLLMAAAAERPLWCSQERGQVAGMGLVARATGACGHRCMS